MQLPDTKTGLNHKVIASLLRIWGFKLARAARSTEPSPVRQAISEASGNLNLVEDLNEEEIGLFDLLYTEFSEICYSNGRVKAWLISVIDYRSKLIFGWAVGKSASREVSLNVWNRTWETINGFKVQVVGSGGNTRISDVQKY